MEPTSRASSEGRVSPGSTLIRRMSPLRHSRYLLAALAAMFALLCVLISHDAMAPLAVPDSLRWTVGGRLRMFTISTADTAEVPHAAVPGSALQPQPAADPELGLHSTGTPVLIVSRSAVDQVRMGPSGAADPVPAALGSPTDRSDAAPAPAASSPEATGPETQHRAVAMGEADAKARNGRQLLPAVVDADDTGAGRTPEEERAADAEGCAVVLSDGPPAQLRVRHSRDTVEPLSATGGGLDADTPFAEIDPLAYQFPFQVPDNPGALTHADMQWCPGSLEPPPEEVPPVNPSYRALFVIGAQKAGTTWLHHVLSLHKAAIFGVPTVVNKNNRYAKAGTPRKELQFFNTWPAPSTEEFLSMWPPWELAAMRNGTSQKFLFDGSPEYLLNAVVAPRLKQMVPQAKIVIVLRDPTARAFSAWGMKSGWGKFCDSDDVWLSELCVERSFEETFNAWHNSFARSECRFTSPGSNATWGGCFGCRYNLFRFQKCCGAREEHGDALLPCFGVPRGFSVMDYSSYAAQIAWWLQFFPPEQLYIVTSDTLHDERKRVTVLNELLDFVGLPNAPRFTQRQVDTAGAFMGQYGKLSDADLAAQALVRRFHAPQVRDLRVLLARFFPHVNTTALDVWSHPEAAA